MSTTHGGARKGSGRKPKGTKLVGIRLTPEKHRLLNRLGGSKWIDQKLENIMANVNDILNNIFEELADDCESRAELIQSTRDALEDGEVLGAMNISQEESEAAEAALDELAEKPETTKLFVFEGNSLDLMDKDEFMSNFDLEGDYDSWVGQGGNLDDVMDFNSKEQALTYLDDALETGRIDRDDYRTLRVQTLLA